MQFDKTSTTIAELITNLQTLPENTSIVMVDSNGNLQSVRTVIINIGSHIYLQVCESNI